jgi:hypothetical protein
MIQSSYKDIVNGLRHAVCAFGLLISLAALPAYGQQVHQLSYNGSSWTDQNLNGFARTHGPTRTESQWKR